MKIIIHIGTHKTGTTAVQKYFNQNRNSFYAAGLYYPEGQESWPGHHPLAVMINKNQNTPAKEYLDSVVQQAVDKKCDRIFISSETFSVLNAHKRDNLKLFSELGDVKVISVLRNQYEFLQSAYNQHVKMFGVRFAGSIYEFFMYHDFSMRMSYDKMLDGWEKQFGIGSVRAFNFHSFKSKRDIFQLFHKELGLAQYEEKKDPDSTNKSISAEATLYLSRLNSHQDISNNQHNLAIRALTDSFPQNGASLLPTEYQERMMLRFAKSNKNTVNRFLADGVPLSLDDSISSKESVVDYYKDYSEEYFSELLRLVA